MAKRKVQRKIKKAVAKARSKATPKRSAAARPRAKRAPKSALALTSAAPSFTVSDVARSLAWYCDVLGFVVKERWEHEGALMGAELDAGGVTFMIGQDDWKKGRDRVKGEGLRIMCTTSQNVDQIAERIKASGGTTTEPRDDWGMRAFSIEDPDGFKITIAKKLKG